MVYSSRQVNQKNSSQYFHDVYNAVEERFLFFINQSQENSPVARKLSLFVFVSNLAFGQKESHAQKLLNIKGTQFDAIVATDGRGTHTKVMDAVDATPEKSNKRFVIYIKMDVYYEYIVIEKDNPMMIGEGMDALVSYSSTFNTCKTHTFEVDGNGFIEKDIFVVNIAGPQNK